MLENIRNIGIFMLAAQAVIHFAPGKQYEKYIKSVSGIIILFLFLQPFLRLSGADWEGPEAVVEKLSELTDMPAFPVGEEEGSGEAVQMDSSVGGAVISGMETEVKELLNRELEGEEYRVQRVSLRLAEDPMREGTMILSEVKITMTGAAAEGESRIGIDRIVVGDAQNAAEADVLPAYRKRFAALLGIEEERVEVRQGG